MGTSTKADHSHEYLIRQPRCQFIAHQQKPHTSKELERTAFLAVTSRQRFANINAEEKESVGANKQQ
jgi:hypothetical protein